MLNLRSILPKKLSFLKIENKIEAHIMIPVILFILLNTLKISLFNFFIIPVQTPQSFLYKFQITLLLSVIIYPLILCIRTRIVFLIIYAAQIAYIIANLSYYLFYHNYVHILQWITLIREAMLAAGHSAAPMNWQIFVAFIDVPLFLFLFVKYKKVLELNINLRFHRTILAIVSIVIILCIEWNNYVHGYSLAQYTSDQHRGESPIVERYGTLANNFISLYNNLGEQSLVDNLHYGKTQSSKAIHTNPPNFVAIQVESLDANAVNHMYADHYIAPYLHEMASKSIYYPYVLSYHMGGGTSDSEFSIINSVEPLTDYPAIKISNYGYPNSMVNQLEKRNYKTLAFHGNVGDFYNRDVALPKMGFQKFFDINRMKLDNEGWGASDGKVFDFTLRTLAGVKQPFFSYVITMTSHGPFTNASNYYNNPDYEGIEDETVRNYFNSISYVDQAIKDFVTQIQAKYKNTYILIWGDHTPNISSDVYQQASYNYDGKYFEFVPLLIITPDQKAYKEEKVVASFSDIAPTILRASGIQFQIESNGENLINPPAIHELIPFRGGTYIREDLFNEFGKIEKAKEEEQAKEIEKINGSSE